MELDFATRNHDMISGVIAMFVEMVYTRGEYMPAYTELIEANRYSCAELLVVKVLGSCETR